MRHFALALSTRVEGTVDIYSDLRSLKAPFALIGGRHCIAWHIERDGVSERALNKWADLRVIFPKVSLGVNNYRVVIERTLFKCACKIAHSSHIGGKWKRAKIGKQLAYYGQMHICRADHCIDALWKARKSGIEHIAHGLSVVSVDKEAALLLS